MQLTENTLFAGRYKLEKMLGRGGFSEVWLATDSLTDLKVAVKVYAPGQGMDQDGLKEFSKELSNVYNLNHTNLLKPQHVDSWENMPYLIMAFCEKGSCTSLIGKMKEEQIWNFIHDVAAGLDYLHKQDIIHQDIKPDNILIDNNDNFVITDFGISIRSRATLRKSMNAANASVGTTAYMAPERFSAEPTPVKASDIWALGATVYEILTGRAPFGEIGGGLQKSGADLPTIHVEISPELRQTIALMLAEEPWDRPSAALLVDWASNPSTIKFGIKNVHISGSGSNSYLKITPQSFEMDPVGGEQSVYIKTPENWSFFSNGGDWFKVEKQGTVTLKITYSANETGQDRESSVNVVAGPRAAIINLSQKTLPRHSKKALYGSLIAAAVLLIAVITIVVVKKIDENKRIADLKDQYERTTQATRDDIKLMNVNLFGTILKPIQDGDLLTVEGIEHSPDFSKVKISAQSEILKGIYMDSLLSIQTQLEKKIEFTEELKRKYGVEESDISSSLQRSKQMVDKYISLLNSGKSIRDINKEMDVKKQEILDLIENRK